MSGADGEAPPSLVSLAALLGDGGAIDLPETWMQGRTAYGGLSAAMAHHAARRLAPDLPPLRSAQVAFVGPLSGRLEARAEVLRRGRSTAFVQADVQGEAGLGLRAMLVFAAPRASALAYEDLPAPDAPDPDAAEDAMRRPPSRFFGVNFEFRHALPVAARGTPEFLRWARLRDREGVDPTTALLACADAMPPAAMGLMEAPGPVSSVTWQINLLRPDPVSRDGWWLLRAGAEQVCEGLSSQGMQVWDADRRPVISAMQSVAVFV